MAVIVDTISFTFQMSAPGIWPTIIILGPLDSARGRFYQNLEIQISFRICVALLWRIVLGFCSAIISGCRYRLLLVGGGWAITITVELLTCPGLSNSAIWRLVAIGTRFIAI